MTDGCDAEQKKEDEQQWSSDSESTIILELTPADVEKDPNVPELRRTDSVILTREMLGYTSEHSLSCSESSRDEYVPRSTEETKTDSSAESDSLAESIKRHKSKKRKLQETTSANFQEVGVQPLKKMCRTPYYSLTANYTKKSSSPDEDGTRESSSPDSSDLTEAKWNAPQLLPFAEDVKKMHQYLDIKRVECQTKLKDELRRKHWVELAKITLCDVILFNRRREGEVSKMSLNAFTLRDTSSTHPDVELALSDLEKKLCKHFQRIEIRGKHGRKVPILLTPDILTSMELLVKTRRSCDVLDENPFMFGRPQTLSYFRGSDVIRQIAQTCGAEHPEALSSTKLRKHMATMSKVLNLKDNEMDDLVDILGRVHIRVRRQYYRLPEGTLQLAKISKVLMALERGQLSEFKGKNLDEIHIDPRENIAVDSDASDTEDEDATSVTDAASSASLSSTHSSDRSTTGSTSKQNKHLYPATGRSDEEMPPVCEVSGRSHTTKGLSQNKRRKWTEDEVQAVEMTLMNYISSGKVPGKAECLKCIETSPVALKGRTWEGVKFYVKNRIDALKRESMKRR
ncbi:uncharacterized protein LOC113174397 isoform X2 [Anabas testudineus]|uniref:uncharacterized protein LOC113174397 isoform X2 n=1 Tax=Anabas testudineus TaxID=64144 RepID=UPI000E456763|nr:uncharacterized protein LOC113174397 isoform X2 [Anabas testudineus]